jgi:hypothetical protein
VATNVFEDNTTNLAVKTRSLPTAAALWLITGVAPRVERNRFGGDYNYIFPASCEEVLRQFIRAKTACDRLVQEAKS